MPCLKAALFTVVNQGVTDKMIILIMISNSWSPALVYKDSVSSCEGLHGRVGNGVRWGMRIAKYSNQNNYGKKTLHKFNSSLNRKKSRSLVATLGIV